MISIFFLSPLFPPTSPHLSSQHSVGKLKLLHVAIFTLMVRVLERGGGVFVHLCVSVSECECEGCVCVFENVPVLASANLVTLT